MGMNGTTQATTWRPFNVEWDRVVVDVQGNTILIDAPITCSIEKKWGGGEILKYEDPGRIQNVGVENLRGMSEFDPTVRTKDYGNMDRPNYSAEEYYADEDHYWNLITMDNIRNAWVRNVTAMHFVNSLVGAQRGAKWITVQDCVSREPVSRRMGARRFTFALRGELDPGAALPLRQRSPLLHDGPADRDVERVSRLRGNQAILLQRDA